MQKTATLHIITIIILSFACSARAAEPADSSSPTVRPAVEMTASEQAVVRADNSFAFKLFRRVNAGAPAGKNVLLSPFSVSMALAMAANGAAGPTRNEITGVLGIGALSLDDVNQAYRSLTDVLTHADTSVSFGVANSCWSRLGLWMRPDFVDLCRDSYDARAQEIDFAAPGSADTINGWVSNNTDSMITKIIEPPISPDLAAMLLDATYFKGSWTYPFDTAHTHEAPFYRSPSDSVTCPMMTKDTQEDQQLYPGSYGSRPLRYAQNEFCKIVELPYGEAGFRMTVLLPDSSLSADSLASLITPKNWTAWRDSLHSGQFWLSLPKFRFDFEALLNQTLQAMGMASAFNPKFADFSKLFADSVGWINEVRHNTFVQVDEKGTEAAAVTSVRYFDSIPPELVANRPFLFVIHDLETGAILFIGKVADPNAES